MEEKTYLVTMEQKRTVKTSVSARNQREAKERARELLVDGALDDDGPAMSPISLDVLGFSERVVGIKEQKRRG